ncbi:MAG: hypothetical protein JJ900_03070 [Rhodospirillales bacterium]|nr:hypothetical protein [Rhodospirillales bacterium]MBO6785805.1 hypothetical protein [Rhodospirillales bacterium]
MEKNATGIKYAYSISEPQSQSLPDNLVPVYEGWQSLCGKRPHPEWNEWDWALVPPELVPWCTVVDVIPYPLDFVYRMCGEKRIKLYGHDYTGSSVFEVKPAFLSNKILEEYVAVKERGAPIFVSTTGMNMNPTESYGFLRLPFGKQGRIGQILGIGVHLDDKIDRIRALYAAESIPDPDSCF